VNTQPDTIVLIAAKKAGFTKILDGSARKDLLFNKCEALKGKMPDPCWCSRLDNSVQMSVIVEGPYGREIDLRPFGTVLLFATGIGIAAHIPYLRRLVELERHWDAMTKRIALFWEIQSECECLSSRERFTN
jgi:hypothetical protein